MQVVPIIFFCVSVLLAFSTGTSWGTFAILIPIAAAIFNYEAVTLMAMSTAAVLGGAVCGDHLSPISDTTILSSAGAGCDHYQHFSTQMPYGAFAAGISAFAYMVGGILENGFAGLLAGGILIVFLLFMIKKKSQSLIHKEI